MTAIFGADIGFYRAMRLGSLEVTAALALVAILAARPRVRAAADVGSLTPMEVQLDVRERGARRTVTLRPPCVIGRTSEADLPLRDAEVSRRHARIETQNGVVYVADMGSSNGTFLNGRRVDDVIELREGDEIDVGTTRMVVTSVRAG